MIYTAMIKEAAAEVKVENAVNLLPFFVTFVGQLEHECLIADALESYLTKDMSISLQSLVEIKLTQGAPDGSEQTRRVLDEGTTFAYTGEASFAVSPDILLPPLSMVQTAQIVALLNSDALHDFLLDQYGMDLQVEDIGSADVTIDGQLNDETQSQGNTYETSLERLDSGCLGNIEARKSEDKRNDSVFIMGVVLGCLIIFVLAVCAFFLLYRLKKEYAEHKFKKQTAVLSRDDANICPWHEKEEIGKHVDFRYQQQSVDVPRYAAYIDPEQQGESQVTGEPVMDVIKGMDQVELGKDNDVRLQENVILVDRTDVTIDPDQQEAICHNDDTLTDVNVDFGFQMVAQGNISVDSAKQQGLSVTKVDLRINQLDDVESLEDGSIISTEPNSTNIAPMDPHTEFQDSCDAILRKAQSKSLNRRRAEPGDDQPSPPHMAKKRVAVKTEEIGLQPDDIEPPKPPSAMTNERLVVRLVESAVIGTVCSMIEEGDESIVTHQSESEDSDIGSSTIQGDETDEDNSSNALEALDGFAELQGAPSFEAAPALAMLSRCHSKDDDTNRPPHRPAVGFRINAPMPVDHESPEDSTLDDDDVSGSESDNDSCFAPSDGSSRSFELYDRLRGQALAAKKRSLEAHFGTSMVHAEHHRPNMHGKLNHEDLISTTDYSTDSETSSENNSHPRNSGTTPRRQSAKVMIREPPVAETIIYERGSKPQFRHGRVLYHPDETSSSDDSDGRFSRYAAVDHSDMHMMDNAELMGEKRWLSSCEGDKQSVMR
jgi:hypothetical protein